ncbi:MAG: hypothetical protein M3018_14795, partial [Actinomycetota bacterium]|nr:hypothetical protein [Actinomycetota bacterium]
RVMSLWFVAFQGSTPIGGPIVGLLMAWLGARAGLGLGAVACIAAAVAGTVVIRRSSSVERAGAGLEAQAAAGR